LTETPCDGARICGYLHEHRTSDRLLLLFHGNGELAADYDRLGSMFVECGASFWVIDYRGYGRSTGVPSFSSMLRDAEAVLSDIPRIAKLLGRPLAPVFVMGRSLGSAPAIHLAATRPERLAGLVLDSPYADVIALLARLGGPVLERAALPGFQDNLDKIRACRLPCLLIHGSNDRIVPPTDAVALHAACPSKVKQLLTVAGAGHNDLLAVGHAAYFRTLTEFLARASAEAHHGARGTPEDLLTS